MTIFLAEEFCEAATPTTGVSTENDFQPPFLSIKSINNQCSVFAVAPWRMFPLATGLVMNTRRCNIVTYGQKTSTAYTFRVRVMVAVSDEDGGYAIRTTCR